MATIMINTTGLKSEELKNEHFESVYKSALKPKEFIHGESKFS